jgi:hypothetical protein
MKDKSDESRWRLKLVRVEVIAKRDEAAITRLTLSSPPFFTLRLLSSPMDIALLCRSPK